MSELNSDDKPAKKTSLLTVDVRVLDMEPIKSLIRCLGDNFDQLPQEVKDLLMKIGEEK